MSSRYAGRPTSYGADGPAATVMINDGCIALDHSIHGKIAPISGIGDLSILENLHSHLDSVASRTAIAEDQHCNLSSTIIMLVT
jgi:hypothetical protein